MESLGWVMECKVGLDNCSCIVLYSVWPISALWELHDGLRFLARERMQVGWVASSVSGLKSKDATANYVKRGAFFSRFSLGERVVLFEA